jgi:hypothetical protein
MQKFFTKAIRNKRSECELFLLSLQFAKEFQTIKTDLFCSELDTQLKELITDFADVTKDPQGVSPHRGICDHRTRLIAYSKRWRRFRMSVLEFEELKRQCTNLFKQGSVRVSNSPYVARIVVARKLMDQFEYVSMTKH